MSHCLVKFVEDGLYHICLKSQVKYDREEFGLVSAKYKGIFFRAVVISEGGKKVISFITFQFYTLGIKLGYFNLNVYSLIIIML